MRDDKEDEEKGIVLPRFFKSILSSAVIAVAGAGFQMYTSVELIKQEQAAERRANERRDERDDKFDQRLSAVERGTDELAREAIGKLDYIAGRLRK